MANAGFSSRHMPAPRSHAAKWGPVVNNSEDVAEGIIEKNASRQFSLDRVTLRTRIAWEGNAWEMSRADELHILHMRSASTPIRFALKSGANA